MLHGHQLPYKEQYHQQKLNYTIYKVINVRQKEQRPQYTSLWHPSFDVTIYRMLPFNQNPLLAVVKVVFKQFEQITTNAQALEFIDNTCMLYTVKCFTNITKYDSYIFLFVQCFTEYMIKVWQLIHCGVIWPKS